ncbi:MAG: two-component system sensor histidine kinase NtrB [Gemmatimonadaceae bacterium]
MPRLAREAAPIGIARAPSLLSLVAEVAGLAARTPRADRALPKILRSIREALSALDCTLWRPSAAGLPAIWRAGEEESEATTPVLDLETDGAGVAAVTIRHGGRDLAVLSVRLGRLMSLEERKTLRAVADILAPLLASDPPPVPDVDSAEPVVNDDRRLVQKIVDSLPLGLYVIDREYRIQAWNRKRETGMQGVSREEAIGRTIFEILHRQSAATLRAEFDEVFSTGRIRQTELDTLAAGEHRTFRMSKIPMRLDDGAVTHVITIGEDITESRRAQERLAQSEKLAAVGQLAAGVMHEINNPLATIGVCADGIARRVEALAPDESTRKAIDEYLALVWHEVDRCRGIADRLLDFSRPRPMVLTTLDVHDILDKTLLLLAHHSRFRRTTVRRDFESTPLTISANVEALIQAFMALLLNASDAMENAGTITLSTRANSASGELVVEIVDEGHGIPREELQRLFDPFFTTKEPGQGTGLGLSICYGIINDHGGRIEVESEMGQGSIFRVFLVLESAA